MITFEEFTSDIDFEGYSYVFNTCEKLFNGEFYGNFHSRTFAGNFAFHMLRKNQDLVFYRTKVSPSEETFTYPLMKTFEKEKVEAKGRLSVFTISTAKDIVMDLETGSGMENVIVMGGTEIYDEMKFDLENRQINLLSDLRIIFIP